MDTLKHVTGSFGSAPREQRRCQNCHEPIRWGLWCTDCVRMVAETLLAQAVATAVTYGLIWLRRQF